MSSDSDSNQNDWNNFKFTEFHFNLDDFHMGKTVGVGETGQEVVRLKNSNIVVKQCDSHNNHYGFQMLQTEIRIYERISPYKLKHVPKYYGACDLYGQYLLGIEYIEGKPCNWKNDADLKKMVKVAVAEFKSVGVVNLDLSPENVLLTPKGQIKLIGFGKALDLGTIAKPKTSSSTTQTDLE